MKTLIELYDERPMENFLAADVFRPEHIVYLCPSAVAQDKTSQQQMTDYLRWRKINADVSFLDTSLLHTDKVLRQLEYVSGKYPDCAIDITGGSDAALFAAGQFCSSANVPAFTYSRRKNMFFSICNADFAHHLKPEVSYKIEDYIRMAGGNLKTGRVQQNELLRYYGKIDGFYQIFMKYRKEWKKNICWFQRATQQEKDGEPELAVSCPYIVKGERGSRISADEEFLRDVEKLGFIHDLKIDSGSRVSFCFQDQQTRFWLRDTGSVLELYVWKACRDSKLFNDVECSTIVTWENRDLNSTVTNEIDVTASHGIIPVFISCKTCAISTEALNELAILKEHFGGEMAKAFIVSSEYCSAPARRRADVLGIDVISLNELKSGKLSRHLRGYFI